MEIYIPVAAGRTACSSLPERIRSEFRSTTEENNRLTLIELVQESALYGFSAIALNEASEELVVHLPAVHGFLVFHAFFGDEDVDDFLVGHGTVTFEPLADDVAEVGWREVESVEGAYFWSLVGLC